MLLNFLIIQHADAMHSVRRFRSRFQPATAHGLKILREGKILAPGEEPHQMVDRVLGVLAQSDDYFKHGPKDTQRFVQRVGQLMDNHDIVWSTPILTNAGRFLDRPLSACAVPPIELKSDRHSLKTMIDQYHQQGMGTGFNLTLLDKPIEMLKFLNDVACQGAASMKEERPVGNMAILDVDSPHIDDFIRAKVGADALRQDWKFNISVNITSAFREALKHGIPFRLKNGAEREPASLLRAIANAAHECSDPGLICLDLLNRDNPTPDLGAYVSTAPCAEVGLAPGETCVFGYINLAKFVKDGAFDFDRLIDTARIMTRALDDFLQTSIDRYSYSQSSAIMGAKRKIGIGICGYADALALLNLRYGEEAACALLQDILNTISFYSKDASVELAEHRGSFPALPKSKFMDPGFLLEKYGKASTPHVSTDQWLKLAKKISTDSLLRHATTTTLPPTGRSGQLINASLGIEPLFSLQRPFMENAILMQFLRSNNIKVDSEQEVCSWLEKNDHPFITATSVTPNEHIKVLKAAQKFIDESISKTVNLPHNATEEDIDEIYRHALDSELKGITVYRDGCRVIQPQALDKKKTNGTNAKLIESLVEKAKNEKVEKLSVGAAIINNQGHVLMLKRKADDFMPNIFELPGGGLEKDESLLDALKREVKEETGCAIKEVKKYITHIDFPSSSGLRTRRFNFLIELQEPISVRLSEHSQYIWIDPKDAGQFDITPKTRGILSLLDSLHRHC